jgi:hypothetical protein
MPSYSGTEKTGNFIFAKITDPRNGSNRKKLGRWIVRLDFCVDQKSKVHSTYVNILKKKYEKVRNNFWQMLKRCA